MSNIKEPFVKPSITFIPAGSEAYNRILETIRKEDPVLFQALQGQK